MTPQASYDAVADELSKQDIKGGLWTRAFAESGGDEAKTKATYIQLRASQLHQQMRGTPASGRTRSCSPFSHYGRLAYFLTAFAMLLIWVPLTVMISDPFGQKFFMCVGAALFMIPTFYRLRDVGENVGWVIVSFIPGLSFILHIYLLVAPRGHFADSRRKVAPPPIPSPTM